jgi:hypothetical protein
MALPFLLPIGLAIYLVKTETSKKFQLIADIVCILKCGFEAPTSYGRNLGVI